MKSFVVIEPGRHRNWAPGDTVRGHVLIEAKAAATISSINLTFAGRLQVEIKSRSPTINTINVAQHTFFRTTTNLWQGHDATGDKKTYPFAVKFPLDPSLLPSYSESETPYLAKNVGKAAVEYYLEAQVLGPNASQNSERELLKFLPHRYVLKPAAVPSKLNLEFAYQSSKLTSTRKPSFKDRFRSGSSSSTKEPIVHFRLNFVHSSEAVLGQTLHMFVDLAPDPNRTTALTVPPVYLKAFKIVLVADHALSTSYSSDEQNGVPTKWNYSRSIEIMRWKAQDAAAMILLYDKCDLRPHFKDLRIPSMIYPSIEHESMKLVYHFEITAEFDCLGKVIRHENGRCNPIKLLPSALDPAMAVEESAALSMVTSHDGGTFTDDDTCPVCQKTLPQYPERVRQEHLDNCLTTVTSVKFPARPKSVLVMDDYNDFTSPLVVAFMSHMRRTNEQFSKCIGRIVWAEHDHFDVLELPASAEALQGLLSTKGISWSRLPSHRYWESEELNSYDYILYAGQRIQSAQTYLDNAAPAFDETPGQPLSEAPLKHATLLNMANLIPRHKWPHDARDIETAWTKEATSEVRLDNQFEVIKDCVLELSWQLFDLALPGFDRATHPNRFEAPGVLPAELAVPPPLPPELPSFKEPTELPADPLSARRMSSISRRSQQSNYPMDDDDEFYADPRRSSMVKRPSDFLHPTDSRDRAAWQAVPSHVYELP